MKESTVSETLSSKTVRKQLLKFFVYVTFSFVIVSVGIFILYNANVLNFQSTFSLIITSVIIAIVIIYFIVSKRVENSIKMLESERENAQLEKFQAEREFRIIFDNSAIGMLMMDKEGRIIGSNLAIQKMTGFRGDELIYKSFSEFIHPDDLKNFDDLSAELMKGKINSYNVENRYFDKDSKSQWANVYVSLNRDPSGEVLSIIGLVEDITDRKTTENRLQEYSDRLEGMVEERTLELYNAHEQMVRKERLAAIGELAGGISHELRNPLTTIAHSAYYLKMVLSDLDENILKYVDMISSEVDSSEKIISSLLDYTRIQVAYLGKCEIQGLVKEVLGKTEFDSTIEVTNNVPEDFPELFIDRDQIKQVLTNLITNAKQAMPNGGKFEIDAILEGNKARIDIYDTGVGIKKSNMKRLFEPLFSTKSEGIGLGLTLSQKIAEANGGIISVKSEEGVGTTFSLTLPKY